MALYCANGLYVREKIWSKSLIMYGSALIKVAERKVVLFLIKLPNSDQTGLWLCCDFIFAPRLHGAPLMDYDEYGYQYILANIAP